MTVDKMCEMNKKTLYYFVQYIPNDREKGKLKKRVCRAEYDNTFFFVSMCLFCATISAGNVSKKKLKKVWIFVVNLF